MSSIALFGMLIGIFFVLMFRNVFLAFNWLMAMILFHGLVLLIASEIGNQKLILLIKAWKEIVAIILLLYVIIINVKKKNVSFINIKFHLQNIDIVIILFTLFTATYVSRNKDIVAGLYGFRNYCFPFVFYYIGKYVGYNNDYVNKLMRTVCNVFTLICIWGIIQARFLGERYIINYKYYGWIKLPPPFYISGFVGVQRVTGTFSDPNTFAIIGIIVIIYMLGRILLKNEKNLYSYIKLTIVLLSVVLSFSRSAWLGLFVASTYIFYSWYSYRKNKKILEIFHVIKNKNKATRILAFVTGLIILFIFIITNINIKSVDMLLSHIKNTITLKDPSARGHLDSLIISTKFIIDNPLGLGTGMSGPKSRVFFDNILNSESSFFVLGFDLGIFGLLIYIYLLILIIKRLRKFALNQNNKYVELAHIAIAILIGVQVMYLFLPIIQSLEHVYILYAFIGMLNSYMTENEISLSW